MVVLEWLGAGYARLWRRRSCGRSAAAAAGKKGRQKGNGSAGRLGRTLAVMKARPGAAWPARTEHWRRAAVAGDTRRAKPETGRPFNVAIQSVSDPMLCLTASFRNDLSANRRILRANL